MNRNSYDSYDEEPTMAYSRTSETSGRDDYNDGYPENYADGSGDAPVTHFQKTQERLAQVEKDNAKLKPFKPIAIISVIAAVLLLLLSIFILSSGRSDDAQSVIGPEGAPTIVETQTETLTPESVTQTETVVETVTETPEAPAPAEAETVTETQTETTTVTVTQEAPASGNE